MQFAPTVFLCVCVTAVILNVLVFTFEKNIVSFQNKFRRITKITISYCLHCHSASTLKTLSKLLWIGIWVCWTNACSTLICWTNWFRSIEAFPASLTLLENMFLMLDTSCKYTLKLIWEGEKKKTIICKESRDSYQE